MSPLLWGLVLPALTVLLLCAPTGISVLLSWGYFHSIILRAQWHRFWHWVNVALNLCSAMYAIAVWLWASDVTSLSLCVCIWNIWMMIPVRAGVRNLAFNECLLSTYSVLDMTRDFRSLYSSLWIPWWPNTHIIQLKILVTAVKEIECMSFLVLLQVITTNSVT